MKRERLLGLQYLRAVAALMVAYYHLTLQIPAYTSFLAFTKWVKTDYFSEAVPVFFVVSGFVMYISGIDSGPVTFAWRRIARIVPLYWILTIAIVVLAASVPGLLHHATASPRYVLKSLLFIPYRNPAAQNQVFPILGPGWSLDYEMFFYAVFAAALCCAARWRLAVICLALIGSFTIGEVFPAIRSSVYGAEYTSPLLLTFISGIFIGWGYRRKLIRIRPWIGWCLTVAGLLMLVIAGLPEWIRSELVPAGIVVGVVSLDAAGAVPDWSFLRRLGDASYSIYLVHLFAFDALAKVWTHLGFDGRVSAICFASICMAAAVGLALLTYTYIEKPSLSLFNGLLSSMKSRLRPPTASSGVA